MLELGSISESHHWHECSNEGKKKICIIIERKSPNNER